MRNEKRDSLSEIGNRNQEFGFTTGYSDSQPETRIYEPDIFVSRRAQCVSPLEKGDRRSNRRGSRVGKRDRRDEKGVRPFEERHSRLQASDRVSTVGHLQRVERDLQIKGRDLQTKGRDLQTR